MQNYMPCQKSHNDRDLMQPMQFICLVGVGIVIKAPMRDCIAAFLVDVFLRASSTRLLSD